MALTANELQIFEQGAEFGWQMAQQALGGGSTQRGSSLMHAGQLPGLTTKTNTRRRGPGRPRKTTTGATTTSARSHKKRT
jgi:hypothetical protein